MHNKTKTHLYSITARQRHSETKPRRVGRVRGYWLLLFRGGGYKGLYKAHTGSLVHCTRPKWQKEDQREEVDKPPCTRPRQEYKKLVHTHTEVYIALSHCDTPRTT